MGAFSQGEKVEQFGDIVSPVSLISSILASTYLPLPNPCRIIPHIRVMSLLPEAGSNRCTLFEDHRALVGNGFRGAHIANELLDWATRRVSNVVNP